MKITPQYLAGIFDGEGHIRIQSHNHGKFFKARVCIVNTHLPVMLLIHKQYGGRLEYRRRANERSRRTFAIRWDGTENVKILLETIRPFSIIKKEEIELILDEFIPHIVNRKRKNPLPPETVAARLDMRNRLTAMKHIEWNPEGSS